MDEVKSFKMLKSRKFTSNNNIIIKHEIDGEIFIALTVVIKSLRSLRKKNYIIY